MSVETISGGIKIASRTELSQLVPIEVAAFIGTILTTKREIQTALDVGNDRAVDAREYLLGKADRPQRFEFYVGHIGNPITKATHLLSHVAFRNVLNFSSDLAYDHYADRFLPIEEADQITSGSLIEPTRALYVVEDHHALPELPGDGYGPAGVISYLSPDLKDVFDQQLMDREPATLRAAKHLIAEA